MRSRVDFKSYNREVYVDYKHKFPEAKIDYLTWKNIIYSFNEELRDYALETGNPVKLPYGFGEFSIMRKKRKKFKNSPVGEQINLAINWIASKKSGKRIYYFNDDTDGFLYGWVWNKSTARLLLTSFFFFKPSRLSSRLIKHYLTKDDKYKTLYKENIKQI